MARERIRIERIDADGAKWEYKMEGAITREKMWRVCEALGIMDVEMDAVDNTPEQPNMDSTGEKIWHVVDKYFPVGKFKSTAVLEKYEDYLKEPVKLSVISTYLSRFSTKGRLDRVRTGREWTYQVVKIAQKH